MASSSSSYSAPALTPTPTSLCPPSSAVSVAATTASGPTATLERVDILVKGHLSDPASTGSSPPVKTPATSSSEGVATVSFASSSSSSSSRSSAAGIAPPPTVDVERQQAFRSAVRARLAKEPLPTRVFPDGSTKEFRAAAEEACYYFSHPVPPGVPIRVFRGKEHVCVTTEKIPGFLFKCEQKRGDMTSYVETAERARKLCESAHLDQLYVPHCKQLDFDKSVVIEELAELWPGGHEGQKACHWWALSDDELRPYIQRGLEQLTHFVLSMNIADIRFENVSRTKDGRIALFDLDEASALIGLTSGSARKGKDGIFNMIPLAWFESFIQLATPLLKTEECEVFQKRLEALTKRAGKREKHIYRVEAFHKAQRITHLTQQLVFQRDLFSKHSPDTILVAEKLMVHVNQQIAELLLVSRIMGRNIAVKANICDEFFQEIVTHPHFESRDMGYREFRAITETALKALQEVGYILSYKHDSGRKRIFIVC